MERPTAPCAGCWLHVTQPTATDLAAVLEFGVPAALLDQITWPAPDLRDGLIPADYARLAPHASAAVPTTEHFDPLLFTAGTVLPGDVVYDIYDGFRHGTLSMRSLALTGRRKEDRGF